MRIAIVSDIHGNLEALHAVLREIDQSRVDRIVSLGDNVGYGPDPDEVVRTLQRLDVHSVMGNHELGLVDPSSHPWFNKSALTSLLITRRLLSDPSLESIAALPSTWVEGGALFVHGCPPNSISRYVFEISLQEMAVLIQSLAQNICFVGHTHVLSLYVDDGEQVEEVPLGEGIHELRGPRRYLVNAGSVGQPRDGDNRAKYLIWMPEEGLLEVHCVAYDIAKTAARILERGFPRFNADRLW